MPNLPLDRIIRVGSAEARSRIYTEVFTSSLSLQFRLIARFRNSSLPQNEFKLVTLNSKSTKFTLPELMIEAKRKTCSRQQ